MSDALETTVLLELSVKEPIGKEEILQRLRREFIPAELTHITVIAGAALTLHGAKETAADVDADVDNLDVLKQMAARRHLALSASVINGAPRLEVGGWCEMFYDPPHSDKRRERVGGVWVATPEALVAWYEMMVRECGRPKDGVNLARARRLLESGEQGMEEGTVAYLELGLLAEHFEDELQTSCRLAALLAEEGCPFSEDAKEDHEVNRSYEYRDRSRVGITLQIMWNRLLTAKFNRSKLENTRAAFERAVPRIDSLGDIAFLRRDLHAGIATMEARVRNVQDAEERKEAKRHLEWLRGRGAEASDHPCEGATSPNLAFDCLFK
jgi:hypothetical protein